MSRSLVEDTQGIIDGGFKVKRGEFVHVANLFYQNYRMMTKKQRSLLVLTEYNPMYQYFIESIDEVNSMES